MALTINNTSSSVVDYSASDAAAQQQAEQAAGTDAASKTIAATAAGTHAVLPASVTGNPTVNSLVTGVNASSVARTARASFGLTSSVPELPVAKVEGSASGTARAAASVVSNFNLSDSEAYRIIQQMSQKNFALDATLTNLGNKAVISAKMKQVNDLHTQIQGERKSAVTTMAYSLLAAGTSGTMAYKGTKMRQAEEIGGENAMTQWSKENKSIASNDSLDEGAKAAAQKKNFESLYEKYDEAKLKPAEEARSRAVSNDSTPVEASRKESFNDKSLNALHQYRKDRTPDGGAPSARKSAVEEDMRSWLADTSQKKHVQMDSATKAATGAAIDATGQAAGQVVNSLGTMTDKLAGGQHEADQAKLAQKEDDVQVSIAQQVLDSAKAMKEKDLKDVSDALDKIKDAASRYAAVIDKIG